MQPSYFTFGALSYSPRRDSLYRSLPLPEWCGKRHSDRRQALRLLQDVEVSGELGKVLGVGLEPHFSVDALLFQWRHSLLAFPTANDANTTAFFRHCAHRLQRRRLSLHAGGALPVYLSYPCFLLALHEAQRQAAADGEQQLDAIAVVGRAVLLSLADDEARSAAAAAVGGSQQNDASTESDEDDNDEAKESNNNSPNNNNNNDTGNDHGNTSSASTTDPADNDDIDGAHKGVQNGPRSLQEVCDMLRDASSWVLLVDHVYSSIEPLRRFLQRYSHLVNLVSERYATEQKASIGNDESSSLPPDPRFFEGLEELGGAESERRPILLQKLFVSCDPQVFVEESLGDFFRAFFLDRIGEFEAVELFQELLTEWSESGLVSEAKLRASQRQPYDIDFDGSLYHVFLSGCAYALAEDDAPAINHWYRVLEVLSASRRSTKHLTYQVGLLAVAQHTAAGLPALQAVDVESLLNETEENLQVSSETSRPPSPRSQVGFVRDFLAPFLASAAPCFPIRFAHYATRQFFCAQYLAREDVKMDVGLAAAARLGLPTQVPGSFANQTVCFIYSPTFMSNLWWDAVLYQIGIQTGIYPLSFRVCAWRETSNLLLYEWLLQLKSQACSPLRPEATKRRSGSQQGTSTASNTKLFEYAVDGDLGRRIFWLLCRVEAGRSLLRVSTDSASFRFGPDDVLPHFVRAVLAQPKSGYDLVNALRFHDVVRTFPYLVDGASISAHLAELILDAAKVRPWAGDYYASLLAKLAFVGTLPGSVISDQGRAIDRSKSTAKRAVATTFFERYLGVLSSHWVQHRVAQDVHSQMRVSLEGLLSSLNDRNAWVSGEAHNALLNVAMAHSSVVSRSAQLRERVARGISALGSALFAKATGQGGKWVASSGADEAKTGWRRSALTHCNVMVDFLADVICQPQQRCLASLPFLLFAWGDEHSFYTPYYMRSHHHQSSPGSVMVAAMDTLVTIHRILGKRQESKGDSKNGCNKSNGAKGGDSENHTELWSACLVAMGYPQHLVQQDEWRPAVLQAFREVSKWNVPFLRFLSSSLLNRSPQDKLAVLEHVRDMRNGEERQYLVWREALLALAQSEKGEALLCQQLLKPEVGKRETKDTLACLVAPEPHTDAQRLISWTSALISAALSLDLHSGTLALCLRKVRSVVSYGRVPLEWLTQQQVERLLAKIPTQNVIHLEALTDIIYIVRSSRRRCEGGALLRLLSQVVLQCSVGRRDSHLQEVLGLVEEIAAAVMDGVCTFEAAAHSAEAWALVKSVHESENLNTEVANAVVPCLTRVLGAIGGEEVRRMCWGGVRSDVALLVSTGASVLQLLAAQDTEPAVDVTEVQRLLAKWREHPNVSSVLLGLFGHLAVGRAALSATALLRELFPRIVRFPLSPVERGTAVRVAKLCIEHCEDYEELGWLVDECFAAVDAEMTALETRQAVWALSLLKYLVRMAAKCKEERPGLNALIGRIGSHDALLLSILQSASSGGSTIGKSPSNSGSHSDGSLDTVSNVMTSVRLVSVVLGIVQYLVEFERAQFDEPAEGGHTSRYSKVVVAMICDSKLRSAETRRVVLKVVGAMGRDVLLQGLRNIRQENGSKRGGWGGLLGKIGMHAHPPGEEQGSEEEREKALLAPLFRFYDRMLTMKEKLGLIEVFTLITFGKKTLRAGDEGVQKTVKIIGDMLRSGDTYAVNELSNIVSKNSAIVMPHVWRMITETPKERGVVRKWLAYMRKYYEPSSAHTLLRVSLEEAKASLQGFCEAASRTEADVSQCYRMFSVVYWVLQHVEKPPDGEILEDLRRLCVRAAKYVFKILKHSSAGRYATSEMREALVIYICLITLRFKPDDTMLLSESLWYEHLRAAVDAMPFGVGRSLWELLQQQGDMLLF